MWLSTLAVQAVLVAATSTASEMVMHGLAQPPNNIKQQVKMVQRHHNVESIANSQPEQHNT
jgi:hypothetical protein